MMESPSNTGAFSSIQDPCIQGTEPEESMLTSTEPSSEGATESGFGQVETFEEYDPYSFSKEMEKLEDMHKTLETVKHRFNESNMRSLLLNADVVTMFDPVSSEDLKSIVMDCRQCADRIAEMQSTNIDSHHTGDDITDEASVRDETTIRGQDATLSEGSGNNNCVIEQPVNED